MTAISNFYLFINRKYGGGENMLIDFKNDADTNRNNVIQFNELKGFIQANKSDSFLAPLTNSDVYSIWNELDVSIKGYNNQATGKVSENGSLNSAEEDRLTERIELYGVIDRILNDVLNDSVKSILNKYGIDYDTIYYMTADVMVKSGNIKELADGKHDNDLRALANDCVKKAAASIIKEKVLDDDSFKQQIKDKYNLDYDLKNDKNLVDNLIEKEIEKIIGNSSTTITENLLDSIQNRISGVIKEYLKTANIGYGSWYNHGDHGAVPVVTWDDDPNAKLNNLQLVVLEQTCKDKLNPDVPELKSYVDAGFTKELKAAIDNYIATLREGWKNVQSIDFNIELSKLSGIVAEFTTNSDEIKALNNIVQLSGINKPSEYGITNASDESAWSGLYGSTDPNDTPNAEYILSLLHFIGGMSGDALNKLIGSATYKNYLKEAYTAIIADKDSFGITDMGDMKQIQNAILKYFKEHLTDILKEIGLDNKDIAEALCNNALSTYDIIDKDYCNNTIKREDAIKAAKEFVRFILSVYANNSKVITALTESGLAKIDELGGLSRTEIETGMKAVLDAIKETPADNGGNDGGNGGNSGVDDIVNNYNATSMGYDYAVFKQYLYGKFDKDIVDNAWEEAYQLCKDSQGKVQWGEFKNQLIKSIKNWQVIHDIGNDPAAWNSGNHMGHCDDDNITGYARIRSNISDYGDGWSDFKPLLKGSFESFAGSIKQAAIKNWGSDPAKAQKAATTLVNYCMAVVEAILKAKSDGNDGYDIDDYVKTDNYDVNIDYEDADGNSHSESTSVVFGASNKEKEVNQIKDFQNYHGKSKSGIYVGCDRSGDDAYLVFVDLSVMAEKFKQFLG